MHRRRIAVFAGLLAPLVTAAGCSLINSYDAVKEAPGGDDATGDDATGDDVGSPTPDGTMMETGSSSGGEASSDVTVGTIDAPAETTTTNQPEAAVDAGSPAGAIVIGGRIAPNYVLAVLDPVTGNMKNQSTMSVAGVAYDGVFDVWYIFDTGIPNSLNANPGVPVTLHVRRLDTRPGGTWAWTELATLSVPPIFSGQQIAVLADRLAYVSFAPPDGGVLTQLTVIDTTNFGSATPDAGAPFSSIPLTGFPSGPSGLTGAPPTAGAGGLLALLQNTSTSSAPGVFQLVTVEVNNGGTTLGGNYPVYPAPNQIALAGCATSNIGSLYGFLLDAPYFGPDGGVTGAGLTNFTIGNTSLSTGANASFTFQGAASRLNPIAFATCPGLAIVSEGLVPASATNNIFALPLGMQAPDGGFPGFPVQQITSVSGAAFEPFTNTVVVIGSAPSANFLLGLQLNASGSGPPSLSNRGASWMPPNNLVTSSIAVRQPQSFQCP